MCPVGPPAPACLPSSLQPVRQGLQRALEQLTNGVPAIQGSHLRPAAYRAGHGGAGGAPHPGPGHTSHPCPGRPHCSPPHPSNIPISAVLFANVATHLRNTDPPALSTTNYLHVHRQPVG